MNKIAVFPGTFDPFTKGHENIVQRALPLFDKIIIAIGKHSLKTPLFTITQRLRMIEELYHDNRKIDIQSYEGLTIDFCRDYNARYLLRGLRTAADFEYERAIAQVNRKMNDQIETVFLLTTPEFTPVNSTIIRDILRHGGDASPFLPDKMKLYDDEQ